MTDLANAACESFMKTLQYEEVLRNGYRDLAGARASIREFLEKVYNEKRLHSALGYLPPALRPTPPLIVRMSFRLVIPWRVALPQSPPPLHQPGSSML